jgi:hypothetical protein
MIEDHPVTLLLTFAALAGSVGWLAWDVGYDLGRRSRAQTIILQLPPGTTITTPPATTPPAGASGR